MHQHDCSLLFTALLRVQGLLDHGDLSLEVDQFGEGVGLLTDVILEACHVVEILVRRMLDELHPVELQQCR